MLKKRFLFTPGPTPIPERVLAAMARPIINHRSQDFKDLLAKVRLQLKEVFQTMNEILILSSSGTGAMEGALTSCLKKTDEVLVINAGKFGERFSKIARAYDLKTHEIKIEWGKAVSPGAVEEFLKKNKVAALCIQASETSTGTQHPISEIAKVVRKVSPETLLIVDGITAVGASPIATDEWDLDILISGSQKAFMLPPGLSFASLSARAIERMKSANLPCFYFDFRRELKSIQDNQTAFTPAISLVVGLHESLSMLLEEGLSEVFKRHELLASATRRSLEAMGLRLASESPSVACSAAFLPEGVDGKALLKKIRDRYGFTIAGGQDAWEGRAIRLSHLGYYSPFDLVNAVLALGRSLEREGLKVDMSCTLDAFIKNIDL